MTAPDGEDLGERDRQKRRLLFAGAGLGAAALGLGIAFGLSAEGAEDEVESDAAAGEPYDPALSARGRRDATIARAMFVTAGVVGAASLAFWLLVK